MLDPQIKSRQRVRDLAEVYTNEREVNAMLDFVKDMLPTRRCPDRLDALFLEPACGNGNFIEKILERKLKYVKPRPQEGRAYEYDILRAVVSIYGIDISDDNRYECDIRIRQYIKNKVSLELHTYRVSEGFEAALNRILQTNIVCANTLTDGPTLSLVEYKPVGDGMFQRSWSHALVPGAVSHAEDSRPVHYSELLDNPEPV